MNPVRDWFARPKSSHDSAIVIDLESGDHKQTDAHYTLQWGRDKAFLDFLEKQPKAKAIMPAGQMGWPTLFEEIRSKAKSGIVHVYDAACGFGGITRELVTEETAAGIRYVGADIHHSLDLIAEKVPALAKCGMLLRWDVSNPLPTDQRFDYIICRAAIHHTPDPRKTFTSLVSRLKPGGQIAVTAYRKKSIAREALDDAFRNEMVPMDPDAAFALSRQFTVLGQALQQVTQKVTLPEDLPLFGIKAGEHNVQMLFYNHFLKCFFNPVFGEEYSTLVNFDWYHPRFAYRYRTDEVQKWFDEEGLTVTKYSEIEAQMYFQASKK